MKFAPDHRGERVMSVDITAMIDVVFLLIIFFMTTAQFVRMTKAEVDLPKQEGEIEASHQAPGLVVNVTSRGEFIVDSQSVTLGQLSRMIGIEIGREGAERVDVLVRADQGAPATHINAIADELARQGVRGWRLATERPPTPRGSGGGP